MTQEVTLPLTGSGAATADVAVNLRPSDNAAIQLIKQDWADPTSSTLLATALSPGGNADLDATLITNTKTGQLIACDIGSSVPLRVDIQLVDGARTTVATVYTGLAGSKVWISPAPSVFELVGNGSSRRFGVSTTNLSAWQTADARVTVYWDEVS